MFSDVEDRAEKLCPRSHCQELSELGLGRGLWDSLLVLHLCPGRSNSERQDIRCRPSLWFFRRGPCTGRLSIAGDLVTRTDPTAEWLNQIPRVGSVSYVETSSQPIRVHAHMCEAPHFGAEALGPQVRTLSKFTVRAGAETPMWSLFCALYSCPHTGRKTPNVGI